MTVPMDSTSDLSSRERVQRLYDKNVDLENRRRKAAQNRIPSDPNAWQQMRENYEAIVLENHAFSEQHEVEYALWQLHYRRIEELRTHLSAALASAGSVATQNAKGPTRPGPDRVKKIRAQFKTFLSEATGFYHEFMLKIRAKYGLSLGYFSDDQENQNTVEGGKYSINVKKGLISCHRCLIYLGDLARYKGVYGEGESKARDFAAAASYYMQASSLLPSSGNPHHQLAILATYTGDEMVAIYRYFRSLAVDNPFTTARDNLTIAFEKNRQSYAQLFGNAKAAARVPPPQAPGKGRGKSETRVSKDTKVEDTLVKQNATGGTIETSKSFSISFIRLNGLLFTKTSLETFEEVLSMVKSDLLKLLASGPEEVYNVGSDAADCRLFIVRLVAILIFTVHNVKRETENQSYAEILQRSVLLKNAFTALFEFMGHILERCTKLNDPSKSYLLPGIMVFVEWLACQQDIAVGTEVEEKQASARLFFWNQCVSFLNKLSGGLSTRAGDDEIRFFNTRTYDEGEAAYRFALFEDFELRGFLPLLPAQLILDFSTKSSLGSDGGNKGKAARLQRIIAAGKALANMLPAGQQGVYFDSKLNKFCIGLEPQQTDDLSLSNSLESSGLSGAAEENLAKSQIDLWQPKLHACSEGEEEDEVIVFRPTISEKHANDSALKLASSEVSGSHVSSSTVGFGGNAVFVPPSSDSFLLQHALGTNSRPPTSIANIPGQYLPQIQPSTSIALLEQQAPIAEELRNLRLAQNGSPMKYDVQDQYSALLPAAYSVPFPNHTVNLKPGNNNHQVQVAADNAVPSMFSSAMPSEFSMDSLSMKTSSMMPTAVRKNPVSRPVRHTGPPPGFNSVPQRFVEEPFSGGILNNGNPRVDDYSWLDGFQFPPSSQGIGFNKSLYPTGQSHPHHPTMGLMNFPFPGKQVSTFQVQPEKQEMQNYFSGSMGLNHHQQFQEGNQQSIALPEQLQGDQLYQDRFIV